jgi:mersacidin/lichenicidin family type 2 lantibiotic
MSKIDIIRAWKDPEYRASLSEEQRAQVPAHPAGLIELKDEELTKVLGMGKPTAACNTQQAFTCHLGPC